MHKSKQQTTLNTFQLSTLVLALMALNPVHAADNDVQSLGVIQVTGTGQAASMNAALREQQSSDSISSVVHADGIGQLPDDNAAEALQRLPGVSVERDQGEGRFVTVRGLSADLNAVTINGTLVPAPESNRRGVALDVLPAELVQSLAVVKTLTPDLDANSLGGTVQVNSLSAFDHKGLFYTGTAEGSYNSLRDKYSPKFSGAISNRFSILGGEDNFGVAAALSYQNRKFGSDNVETEGEWKGQGLNKISMRYYDIARERLGAGLNFDWRTDSGQYYLRTLYSSFNDTESRYARNVKFDSPCVVNQVCTGKVTRALKAREEDQDIQSYVLGGKQQLGMWLVEGQLGYSEAQEHDPQGLSGAEYTGKFKGLSYSDTKRPVFTSSVSDLNNPKNFTLNSIKEKQALTKDTEKNIKLDFTRDYSLAEHAAQFKFGGKVSHRQKTNDENEWVYKKLNNLGTSDFYGDADYGLASFGPFIDEVAAKNHLVGLDPNKNIDLEASTVNDFKSKENINALYFMNTVDIDKLRVIAGLRFEGTKKTSQGYGYIDGKVSPTSHKQDYNNWLPNLTLRYELDKNTLLRAAYTSTVVRPTFAQSSPGMYVSNTDLEAEFGNPDLKALTANNFDLSVEHYFGTAGTLSANVFYKKIKNFVYQTDVSGQGRWADFDTATTYRNGQQAKIYGLELAYSQKMDQLPVPWNGLIWGLNTTLSHSDATISDTYTTRHIRFPSQSNFVGNALLGWEGERAGVKVSANYKSANVYQITDVSQPALDIYNDKQFFVDISTYYNITKQLKVKFDVGNVTNQAYYAYTGSKSMNAQYETYGPTYKLALTFTHF
ncbi:TonB-dependent receptor [Acinetobacter boissieri]|uniref:TonB-dependent receptor n=1 Tax=Acinetobacter boissieri TaxID=1219383 RepID=A0A1G6GIX6_9GAMM|nr:TonB-dependent receptor [Acinetobacter boissieri]SDB81890.1 TonB-dependent receptor [Acinetobacter boissieri]